MPRQQLTIYVRLEVQRAKWCKTKPRSHNSSFNYRLKRICSVQLSKDIRLLAGKSPQPLCTIPPHLGNHTTQLDAMQSCPQSGGTKTSRQTVSERNEQGWAGVAFQPSAFCVVILRRLLSLDAARFLRRSTLQQCW